MHFSPRFPVHGVALRLCFLCTLLAAEGHAQTSARSPSVASTGPVPGVALTLRDVLAIALRDNPDLVLARARADSALGERRIAVAPPNPTFTTIPGNPWQYSLGVPLDIGPQRFARSRAGALGAAAAALDVADVRRQVIFTVGQAFYAVVLADSLRTVADEQVTLFRRVRAADSARVRSGDVAARNLAVDELEMARAESEAARAAMNTRAARYALQVALGVAHPDTALILAGDLTFHPVAFAMDSLRAVTLANRADLAAAARRVEQSQATRTLARTSVIPVPSVGVVYQPAAPYPSGRYVAPVVSWTVPAFYWFGGERARAAAAVSAAQANARSARAQVEIELAAAIDQFRAAEALARRYDEGLLSRATEALTGTRYAYEHGAVSLLELIEAARAYADTKAQYYTALHDYWLAVLAVRRAVGDASLPQ